MLTNDEIDAYVKNAGGWDVTKKHVRRLLDDFHEYFVPYWVAQLPKMCPEEVQDILGYDFVETVPEFDVMVDTPAGNIFRRVSDLDRAKRIVTHRAEWGYFSQRFVISEPKPEGFTVALRASVSVTSIQSVWSPASIWRNNAAQQVPPHRLSFDGIKVFHGPGMFAAVEDRVRGFLMVTRLAT